MSENDLVAEIEQLANYLDELADGQDAMSEQSRTGGWSTHQVKQNLQIANDARRRAAQARRIVDKYREAE